MKTCAKCGREGLRGFRVNRLGVTVCTQGGVCARRRSPAAIPRLDDADYAARLEAQGGGCALCGTTPKTRRLDVDHDHRTGEVRGLLCHRCNRALPTWVDIEWLAAAAGYLGGPEAEMADGRSTTPERCCPCPKKSCKATCCQNHNHWKSRAVPSPSAADEPGERE